MARKTWVQVYDEELGKHVLVPKEEHRLAPTSAYVQGDVENFVSPITKEVVSDRGQLRRHNAEHGVTNSADYSDKFLHDRRVKRENEMTGNTTEARQERRDLIARELSRNGI